MTTDNRGALERIISFAIAAWAGPGWNCGLSMKFQASPDPGNARTTGQSEKSSDIPFKKISSTYHLIEASKVWLCARAQRSLCAFIVDSV